MDRRVILMGLVLMEAAGCSDSRVETLQGEVTALRAETERLSRALDDLRKNGPAAGGTSSSGSPSVATEALLGAVLEKLAPGNVPAAEFEGVWQRSEGDVREVLHWASGGRLCGWRQNGVTHSGREPFWGTWQVRGGLVVELRDKWVGDHNEARAVLREVELAAGRLTTRTSGEAATWQRVSSALAPLRSLYDDREAPIPGLPAWCLSDEAKPGR